CAMTNHRPHADVSDVDAEAVVSDLPLFWSCFLSSCQANQKIYAYDLLLVEREGWLANGNYTNGTPHWAAKSHLYSPSKRKSKNHLGLSLVCDLGSNSPHRYTHGRPQ